MQVFDKYGNIKTIANTGSIIESDPIWLSDKPDYLTITDAASTYSLASHTHSFSSITSKPTTLSGYGITDAVNQSRTLTINGVTYDLSANRSWTIATGASSWASITGKPTTVSGYGITDVYTDTEIDNFFSGTSSITGYNKTNWDTAYAWGNHASVGYLTNVTSLQITTALGFTPYSNTNPNGYISSYTETDPVFVASAAYGITSTNISNWNTAFGWGNPALTYLPLAGGTLSGSLGIGSSPNSTALLDITSTTKGLLIPRLTTTQKNAISTPATNLIINDTTKKTLDQFNGTSWNSIAGDFNRDLLALQALGSTIKAGPLIWFLPSSGAGLTSTRSFFNAIWVDKEITITGVAFMQTAQGVYTGNNYNGIGLYSYSAGVVTLIDNTTNDADFWKTATTTAGTWVQKTFAGGSRTLQPGIYFLCALYSSSAQTTAPSIGASTWTASNVGTALTTNSARLYGGVITSVTSLPTTQNCSSWNSTTFYFGLYLY